MEIKRINLDENLSHKLVIGDDVLLMNIKGTVLRNIDLHSEEGFSKMISFTFVTAILKRMRNLQKHKKGMDTVVHDKK